MEKKNPDNINNDGFEAPAYLKACPVCTKENAANKLRIISYEGNVIRFHLTCHNCQSSVLINAVANELGAIYVGVLSDLNYKDSLKFKDRQVFCADDVLLFYKELKKKNHLEKKLVYSLKNKLTN